MRADRVNVILHEQQSQNSHSHNSPARMHDNSSARFLHGLHVARSVQNSLNSVGDRGVRGQGVCVPGETKSLSTSTRLRVWCPALEKLASPQQAEVCMVRCGPTFYRNRARRFSGHACTRIHLRVPCMVCMMIIRWEIGLYVDGVLTYLEKQSR